MSENTKETITAPKVPGMSIHDSQPTQPRT